jgi:hypothetical protein
MGKNKSRFDRIISNASRGLLNRPRVRLVPLFRTTWVVQQAIRDDAARLDVHCHLRCQVSRCTWEDQQPDVRLRVVLVKSPAARTA